MNLEKKTKLNHLFKLLPEGVVAPSGWLQANGYSPQLLRQYVRNGWLVKVTRGAYIRPDSVPEWEGVVLGLQKLAQLPFYVGGVSALYLQGYAHYLPMRETGISLYGRGKAPVWTKKIPSVLLTFHGKPNFETIGLKAYHTKIRDWTISIASPERAILEMLYDVGEEGTDFLFVSEIFEGLSTLSPRVLNELLHHCKSRKVKRLFLFFAHYYKFPWLKHISDDIDIGAGKLQLAKGGYYDKTYMITVPKEFYEGK